VLSDSDKTVVTFTWTNPNYATDTATVKYLVEIDSSGHNFSKAAIRTVTGKLNTSYLAKELNNILLGFGFDYNKTYGIDVRVLSSYGNNNEQLPSNIVSLKFKTYKVPPKVMPPSTGTLFIVGSSTAGGWNNAVPVPAQQLTKIDSVTYVDTLFMNGGGQYLLLPSNGNWSPKYAVADNSIAGLSAGGDFGIHVDGMPAPDTYQANFPGPAKTGMYRIFVDFQHGKFTVTPISLFGLLYVPGDYQGWTPASASQLGSPKNDGNYDGYVNIPSGGTYQFKITTTPDWSNAYGDGGGGNMTLGGGSNMSVPAAGFYHITASTVTNKWSATATTWSIIGSFSPSNWSNDVDMTYDAGSNSWKGSITTVAGDQFKFRANHSWGLNLGESGGKGSLAPGGDNIGDPSKNFAIPAGKHTIKLYLNNPGYYTYTVQ
jgi:hypothetical protein